MSNYSKTTDFEAKDSLPTGDSGKIIRGAEFETEFDAISTAIATKADTAGPTFTGTLTFETISDGTIGVTAFVDEDNMASNSATLVPTQQSVKAYVDSQVTAQDLDFQADSGGALSIDLDSETMTFTGGTGIDTSGSGNAVTFAIDSTVATLTGSQTLTNKTLTSPVLNTGVSGTAVLDEDNMASNSATQLATQQSIKAYVDSQVGANNELSEILANGNTTGGTNIVFGDSASVSDDRLVFGAGSDLQIYHSGTHSYIDDAGTGNLTLRGNASVRVEKYEGEILADFAADGAVSLYHDNSVKIATTSSGVSVTGNVAVSGTVDGRDVATDGTKLDTVETNADVTDTANVTAAGALMDSELTSIASVKALNQGVATTDSPTFAAVTVNGNVEFDGLSGTGSVTVTDILDQDDMSGNSATALATQQSIKAYVDSQVATADTLSEVLANGNTTGGTNIAFGDNDRAVFGAGSDLQIYHNGNNSFISDGGTGSLKIAGADVEITTVGGNKYFSGSVNVATLFHTNNPKLATTSTGIDVTGVITTDGMTTSADINFGDSDKAVFGSGNDLQIFHDGSNSFINEAGTGDLTIKASNNLYLMSGSSELYAQFTTDGAATLYHNNAAKLATSSTGIDVTGNLTVDAGSNGKIEFGNITTNYGRLYADSTGTFVGSVTADPLIFRTTNTERMRIDSSGNVGIGVTSVGTKLDISTEANKAGLRVTAPNTTNQSFGGTISAGTSSSDYALNVNNAAGGDLFRIRGDGNVGIGTSSPAQKLHVVGTTRPALIGSDNASNIVKLYNSATGSGSYNGLDLLVNSTSNAQINAYGMPLTFGTSASNGTDVTERMRIDASGNLLVNGTNATAKLVVDGAANSYTTRFNSSTTTGQAFGARIRAGTNSSDYAVLVENTSASSMFAVRGDGNVGIGTSSPDAKIHGVGTQGSGDVPFIFENSATSGVATSSIVFAGNGGGGAEKARIKSAVYGDGYMAFHTNDDSEKMRIDASGTAMFKGGTQDNAIQIWESGSEIARIGPASGALRFLVGSTTTPRMTIDSSGNLLVGKTAVSGSTAGVQMKPAGELSVVRDGNHALILNRLSSDGSLALFQQASTTVGSISVTSSATAYNTSSDQRLKDNIVDAPSASDDIDAIQVRSFDWKADGSHQKYGMVAQELQSVAPEAVTGDADSDDMMGVDYSKLVPMMLKEIQSLRARVAQLEGAN